MTRQKEIKAIKEIFQKPEKGLIRIFFQNVFYKSMKAEANLDLIALNESEAEIIYNIFEQLGND